MLSTHKCIKRGAATLLLLLAASNIHSDNVITRHTDGTTIVRTTTICNARGYRKSTPVEVHFKNGKVQKVVALKNEETVPYFARVKQFLLPLYNNLKISKGKEANPTHRYRRMHRSYIQYQGCTKKHKGSYRLLRETEVGAVANTCNLSKQQTKNRPASLLGGF